MRISLLASVACLGFSLAAHASDISYTITDGTFSPSGTFSGTFDINSATEIIDGADLTATVDGTNYTFDASVADSTIPGLISLTDDGATFDLLINGGLDTLAINTSFGEGADTRLVSATDTTYVANGGTIAATTPEPSSLILLGTGALGLAGSFRRRFLNA